MPIKKYHCDCIYCLYPFGNGAPVCIRIMNETKNTKDMRKCVEKGCKYYKEFRK